MLCYTNTTASAPVAGATYAQQPAVLIGGQTYIFPWIPTARDMNVGDGTSNTIIDPAGRTESTCYMRGLKESINVRTNSGHSWQWRRVCFTMKGPELVTDNNTSPYQFFTQTNNGMVRTMNNINGNAKGDRLLSILFRGQQNVDWINVFNAPLDTKRLSIKYDKTRTIASGNEYGLVRTYRHWHPMNKNLHYDDDERGGSVGVDFMSAFGQAGMGDYYVIDFIQPSADATSVDTISLLPEATLYWHEK